MIGRTRGTGPGAVSTRLPGEAPMVCLRSRVIAGRLYGGSVPAPMFAFYSLRPSCVF